MVYYSLAIILSYTLEDYAEFAIVNATQKAAPQLFKETKIHYHHKNKAIFPLIENLVNIRDSFSAFKYCCGCCLRLINNGIS